MATARRMHHSYSDYLGLESESPLKLEFSDGEVFAMAGGTPEHAALAMQLVQLLSVSLPPGCRIFSSDLKLWVAATELATYPDLTIVCGPLERAPHDPNAVTNPRFIVEVTSRSTEDYDRGSKLSQYQQCPSLRAVVLVSHRQELVTVVARDADGAWSTAEARPGERAVLSRELSFDVRELYGVLAGLG
jgi:Uma2 family endonuclease